MYDAVFFDFDGVLVNSLSFHIEHLKKDMHLTISPQHLKDMHKKNFHAAVSDDDVMRNANWQEYHRIIEKEESAQALHPEARETIEALHASSVRLFVASSGSRRSIQAFLEHHRLHQAFEAVLGYEEGREKRVKFDLLKDEYGVDLARAVFITDTSGDVREAKAVQLKTIAVTFGFHGRPELEAAEPEVVCDSWFEVQKALRMN